MQKRRTAEEIARPLRDFDRDLAKGLTVSGICQRAGIAEMIYYRWRERESGARGLSRLNSQGRAAGADKGYGPLLTLG